MIEPIFVGIIWGFFAGWNISAEVKKPQPAPQAQVQTVQQPAVAGK